MENSFKTIKHLYKRDTKIETINTIGRKETRKFDEHVFTQLISDWSQNIANAKIDSFEYPSWTIRHRVIANFWSPLFIVTLYAFIAFLFGIIKKPSCNVYLWIGLVCSSLQLLLLLPKFSFFNNVTKITIKEEGIYISYLNCKTRLFAFDQIHWFKIDSSHNQNSVCFKKGPKLRRLHMLSYWPIFEQQLKERLLEHNYKEQSYCNGKSRIYAQSDKPSIVFCRGAFPY